MQYVNIHSHTPTTGQGIEIINLIAGVDESENLSQGSFYSAGIHPWYTAHIDKKKEILLSLAKQPNIIAIGECGFDPKSTLTLSEQEQLFIFQANLAEQYKKPLIIHCVRSINELIRVNKLIKPTVPWIIHGFASNHQILTECLKNKFFISLGSQLLQPASTISTIMREIPLKSLFFETDETQKSISEIYLHYSLATEIPLEELREIIYANFVRYFLKQHE
jgi:TatD DNase family protein